MIQNNNLDGANSSKVKGILFKSYSNKINHVVLEKFIGEYLHKTLDIPQDQVFLLPHPLNSNDDHTSKEYDCVGISNSNDDEWIEEIIRIEKEKHPIENNRRRVILRSKKHAFDDGWLTVINGWMSDSDYNNYINKAKSIFLPFPSSFQYRMSGSVVDAFSNHTAVIGSPIPLFIFYSKEYDGICHIANSPVEFIETVISGNLSLNNDNEFLKFVERHSNNVVNDSLKKMIEICS